MLTVMTVHGCRVGNSLTTCRHGMAEAEACNQGIGCGAGACAAQTVAINIIWGTESRWSTSGVSKRGTLQLWQVLYSVTGLPGRLSGGNVDIRSKFITGFHYVGHTAARALGGPA